MRQDRIVARILLIFSVVNVALAAPAVVRQGHPDMTRAASEKRYSTSDDESQLAASAGEPLHLPDSGSWADTRARIPLLFGVIRVIGGSGAIKSISFELVAANANS